MAAINAVSCENDHLHGIYACALTEFRYGSLLLCSVTSTSLGQLELKTMLSNMIYVGMFAPEALVDKYECNFDMRLVTSVVMKTARLAKVALKKRDRRELLQSAVTFI
jgi:hypothetical protein